MKKINYILFAGFLWGFIGISVKLIGGEINPFSLNFFRFLIAFLSLLVLVPFTHKEPLRFPRKDFVSYAVIGLLFAVTTTFFVFALTKTTISNTVLLQASQPFFLMFIAYFLLREKITFPKIITLLIALVGLYVIHPLSKAAFLGDAAAIVSGFFFALLTAYMRYEDKKLHHTSTLWYFFFAALFMLPFPFIFGIGNLFGNIWYLLMLGVLGTGLGYSFYNSALEEMDAETVGLFAMILLPLSSIIFGVAVVKEIPSLTTIAGGVILLAAGVYLKLHIKQTKK